MFMQPLAPLTQPLLSSPFGQIQKSSATSAATTRPQTVAVPTPPTAQAPDSSTAPVPVSAPAASTDADSGARFAFSDEAMAAARQAVPAGDTSQTDSAASKSTGPQVGTTDTAEAPPEIIKPLAGPALPLPAPVAGVTEPVVVAKPEPVVSPEAPEEGDATTASTTSSAEPAAETSPAPASDTSAATTTASTSDATPPATGATQAAPTLEAAPEAATNAADDEELARAAAVDAQNRSKLLSMVEQLRGDQGAPKVILTATADEAPKAAVAAPVRDAT